MLICYTAIVILPTSEMREIQIKCIFAASKEWLSLRRICESQTVTVLISVKI